MGHGGREIRIRDNGMTDLLNPAPDNLRFSHIIATSMEAFQVPIGRVLAWTSNLKYLQHRGVAPQRGEGRGKPGTYSQRDLQMFLFALELQSVGMTPVQMKPILARYEEDFCRAIAFSRPLTIAFPTAGGREATLKLDVPGLITAMGEYADVA